MKTMELFQTSFNCELLPDSPHYPQRGYILFGAQRGRSLWPRIIHTHTFYVYTHSTGNRPPHNRPVDIKWPLHSLPRACAPFWIEKLGNLSLKRNKRAFDAYQDNNVGYNLNMKQIPNCLGFFFFMCVWIYLRKRIRFNRKVDPLSDQISIRLQSLPVVAFIVTLYSKLFQRQEVNPLPSIRFEKESKNCIHRNAIKIHEWNHSNNLVFIHIFIGEEKKNEGGKD